MLLLLVLLQRLQELRYCLQQQLVKGLLVSRCRQQRRRSGRTGLRRQQR